MSDNSTPHQNPQIDLETMRPDLRDMVDVGLNDAFYRMPAAYQEIVAAITTHIAPLEGWPRAVALAYFGVDFPAWQAQQSEGPKPAWGEVVAAVAWMLGCIPPQSVIDAQICRMSTNPVLVDAANQWAARNGANRLFQLINQQDPQVLSFILGESGGESAPVN